VRAITPELEAILKSKFLAGASGFRGRIEIDVVTNEDPSATITQIGVGNAPAGVTMGAPTTTGKLLLAWCVARDASPFAQSFGWTSLSAVVLDKAGADGGGWFYRTSAGETVFPGGTQDAFVVYETDIDGADFWPGNVVLYEVTEAAPSTDLNLGSVTGPTAGQLILFGGIYYPEPEPGGPPPETQTTSPGAGWIEDANYNAGTGHPNTTAMHWDGTTTPLVGSATISWAPLGYGGVMLQIGVAPGLPTTHVFYPRRISIDKSRKVAAAAMTVELDNADGALGRFPDQTVVVEGNVIRAYAWYGDAANELRKFTGVIDKVLEHEDPDADPGIVTITCRDRMKHLLVEEFSASAPQGADEDGAVRTAANGVFLNMEVSDIVAAILDAAGIPSAERVISPTSYMVDEYVLPDGISWAEAILGINRLTDLVGYELWADEDGIIRFAPTGLGGGDTEVDQVPDYTYRVGEDLTELDLAGDDYDLATRVKVRGPLTTNKPAWAETWHTNVIALPVGLFYDAADPDHLYVLDRSTKKLYKLLQSDRSIVSSVTLTGITHPLGISGDPSDATIYWILEAPWKYTGSTTGNKIHKVRRSDQAILATYAIANGRWTTIKVSAAAIWLGNWDTDQVHKHSKADGSSVASYTVTFEAVAQTNPTGIAVDGTTLLLFFYGMSGGNRFLLVDESDPTTVDPTNALGVTSGVISTAGTNILGGEMDTTTHADLYACSDDLGLVWKFALVEPVDETVAVVVADLDLEDEIGLAAQVGDRTHDLTHAGDPDHPFEIRRLTFDLKVITSVAQATESATRLLARYSQRRLTLDVGTVGNPAQQLRDMVAIDDPVAAIDEAERLWMVDTLRTEMDAEGDTFLAVMALLPWQAPY
jgi:hypothetical protein